VKAKLVTAVTKVTAEKEGEETRVKTGQQLEFSTSERRLGTARLRTGTSMCENMSY
jgi:hypothetical protein